MTTEFVLLLGLYAFIILGAFLGERGPVNTFKGSAPRLAAKVERDLAVGRNFRDKIKGTGLMWKDPEQKSGSR